jgi:predicted ester cyclase
MSSREVVEALIAAIDHGDEPGVRALLAPDLVSHGALGDVHGPDGFVGTMLVNVRRAFPDARIELAEVVEEGDMVSFRLTGHGTHLGPFLGVEPTGRPVRIRGIHHARVREGLVVEHWQGPDILALLLDMGMFPPGRAGPPRAGGG